MHNTSHLIFLIRRPYLAIIASSGQRIEKENVHFRVSVPTVWISPEDFEETQKHSPVFLCCFETKRSHFFLSNQSDAKKTKRELSESSGLKWKCCCEFTKTICWRHYLPSCWFRRVWTAQDTVSNEYFSLYRQNRVLIVSTPYDLVYVLIAPPWLTLSAAVTLCRYPHTGCSWQRPLSGFLAGITY